MTIAAFQELLADRLGVPTDFQEILAGFPPTLVQVWIKHACPKQPDCKSGRIPSSAHGLSTAWGARHL